MYSWPWPLIYTAYLVFLYQFNFTAKLCSNNAKNNVENILFNCLRIVIFQNILHIGTSVNKVVSTTNVHSPGLPSKSGLIWSIYILNEDITIDWTSSLGTFLSSNWNHELQYDIYRDDDDSTDEPCDVEISCSVCLLNSQSIIAIFQRVGLKYKWYTLTIRDDYLIRYSIVR